MIDNIDSILEQNKMKKIITKSPLDNNLKEVDIKYLRDWLAIHESNDNIDYNKNLIEFVRRWYPAAHKIILNFAAEYNDENYFGRLHHIDVFDKEGKQVEFDNESNKDYNEEFYSISEDHTTDDVGEDYEETKIIYTEHIDLPKIYIK